MFEDEDIKYWTARADEERRIAASLPRGPSATIHGVLADLYRQAVRKRLEQKSDGGRPILLLWRAKPEE